MTDDADLVDEIRDLVAAKESIDGFDARLKKVEVRVGCAREQGLTLGILASMFVTFLLFGALAFFVEKPGHIDVHEDVPEFSAMARDLERMDGELYELRDIEIHALRNRVKVLESGSSTDG